MIHRRLRITGRVQGVCFRDWTVGIARQSGIAGWVRNRRDGSVEVHAAGEAAAIDRFVAACRQGPPAARVDELTVADAAAEPVSGFERRGTA